MKRFVPAVALVLSLIPLTAFAEETAKPAEPTGTVAPAPSTADLAASLGLGTPEPILASSCHAAAMTSCDNGHWLSCDGNVQCDAGWKWVICDNRSWVCPECAWGASCL